MNPRVLATVCVAGLLAAFVIDLMTPQLFIAAILLDVPIVLSAFAGNRRLTGSLVVAALASNVVAGYVNGLQAGGHWDPVAIGNRFLAALSIVLVGWLALALHRGAEQQGISAAIAEAARRERALREASEKIRTPLSEELVERAIVREAQKLTDARSVSYYRSGGAIEPWLRFEARRELADISESTERRGTNIESALVRSQETGEVNVITRSDAMGRLLLDALACESAIVVPLLEGRSNVGVLLVCFDRDVAEADLQVLRAFADAAATALGQAKLFVELATKNAGLAERSRVIRDIVYALSHDLRTPLSAAGLTLRQAKDGAFGPMPPRYLEILDRSIEANDELQRLAETLLLVAQYESGERSTVHRPIDLARLVRDVVSQMQPLADTKRVTVDLETESVTVSGDSGELRRALVNLFANAVTWSQEGGHIKVGVRARGDVADVFVADEGFGVPAELRDALFMRFAGEHAHGSGTGLGLYIVRRIAEAHGGRARYQPNEPRGSVFRIELPITRVGAMAQAQA